jgi:signal transduction histidine kinase
MLVYSLVVSLLREGNGWHIDTGWKAVTAAAVGAAAALVVLMLLVVARASASRTDAALRNEIARLGAQVQEQASQLRLRDDQMSAQAAELSARTAELSARTAELSTQSDRSAADRALQAQMRAESDQLRQGNQGLRQELDVTRRTIEHVTTELVPAALSGKDVPMGTSADGIDPALAKLMDQVVESALETADQQASMRSAVVALSRRVQASAHRIQEEATLMEDRHPDNADVLEVSMRVDHAAAQQARNAQSMAVLCGEWPGQQWPEPLPLVDVVRAAAGRIIAYRRIEVAGDPDVAVSAPAVEPVIHLVAELLANATQSSPPSTMVPVTIRTVQRGAVIEINDCGIGLDEYRLEQARDIACGKKVIGLAELGEFPQTGLAVVGQYVRRHGFRVDVSESVYGGVRAVVGLPAELVETLDPAESATIPAATTVPEARTPAPAAGISPAAAVSPAAETEAVAEAETAGETPGLPRRQSPRHAAAETHRPQPRETRHIPQEHTPPTPEQAGAWMGAFLNGASADGEPIPDNETASGANTGAEGDTGFDSSPTEQQEQ